MQTDSRNIQHQTDVQTETDRPLKVKPRHVNIWTTAYWVRMILLDIEILGLGNLEEKKRNASLHPEKF